MHNTVLIRGKLFDKTPLVISSIRKWFNGEIILSTWKHEDIDKYRKDVDKIILTEDPGEGPVQQFKRQLVSYNEGINHSTGVKTLVIRTDIICNSDVFEIHDQIQQKPKENFKLFNNKVLIGNMMTIDPDIGVVGEPIYSRYFRICDWFQCGYTEDIIKFSKVISEVDKIKNTILCTEQLWYLIVIKQNLFNNLNIDKFEQILSFNWDIMLNNFIVYNTKTKLNIENFNWNFQPEFLHGYITEEKFNLKHEQHYKLK
jgi:hypothetical protein